MCPESINPEGLRETPEFNQQLRDIAAEVNVPEDAIDDRDFALAADMLAENYRLHGDPTNPAYKHYHDGEHPMDIIRRFWKIWKICRENLPEKFDEPGFRLGMIGGAGHEIFKTDRRPYIIGMDELQSALWVEKKMCGDGYPLIEAARTRNAVIATTAIVEDGTVRQTRLHRGKPDPLKWALALADTNGVFMDGPDALVEDSIDIMLENKGIPLKDALKCDPAELAQALEDEDKYVRDRRIAFVEDLKFYFTDEEQREMIRHAFEENFGHATEATLNVLSVITGSKERTTDLVRNAISAAEQTAGHGRDRVKNVQQILAAGLKNLVEKPDADN